MRTYLVPNSNDDDVIINYITDMDLGEDSDSHLAIASSPGSSQFFNVARTSTPGRPGVEAMLYGTPFPSKLTSHICDGVLIFIEGIVKKSIFIVKKSIL